MTNKDNQITDPGQPAVYQIRIKGHLNEQWVDWFEGMNITLEEDGYTLLTGPVIDQAALHGLLRKVRDAGMTLLSVNPYYSTKGENSMETKVNTNMMKAIVYTQYGSPDVLQLKEITKPTPKDNEVLVKVYAVSVNSGDLHLLRADPFLIRLSSGLLKPKNQILGSDIAGRVEAVGSNIKEFKPGDDVFGNISADGWGGFAEYVSVHEEALALKPANISFEEAAAVPMAAFTALQGIRHAGQIRPGQKVLINGASGGVGTFAVQLAKAFGAEVTAVCSTRNLDVARSLGADHVIDYTKEDFARNGKEYDLILATNGDRSISDYRRALRPKGVYVHTGGSMAQMTQAMIQGPWYSRSGGQKMGSMGVAKPNKKDLLILKELLEAGKVKPVIAKRYPLAQTADAIRDMEAGRSQGKIVITL